MNKRIHDPLPPNCWLRRVLSINLISIPLTVGSWLVIPVELFMHFSYGMGLISLLLICFIYFSWTSLTLIAWRLRETHSLRGDLCLIVFSTGMSTFVVSPVLFALIFFRELY